MIEIEQVLSSLSRKLFLLAFIVFVGCDKDDAGEHEALTYSEEPQITLIKNFGGSLNDQAAAIIATSDGGVAVLGTSESIDGDLSSKQNAGNDYWLLKIDASGTLQWSQAYGGTGDDVGTDLIQTRDGGFLLGGYSMSSDGDASNNEGFHDNWFVKVDVAGNIEWEKSYGFAGHDHSYSVLQTQDGGYFSAGFLDVTASGGLGNETLSRHGVGEFWGQRLDESGALKWRRYYGGTNNDRAYKVLQAQDGGFLMFGLTESDDFDIKNTNGSYEFWAIKINDQGDLLWEQTYGGSGIEQAYDAVQASDGGYILVGQGFSNDGDAQGNHGGSDAWVIKIDAAGALQWQKMLGGSNFDLAQSITPTLNGNYFITGNTRSNDLNTKDNWGENDIWILEINNSGELLSQHTLGGSQIDQGVGIAVDAQGDIWCVATTSSSDGDITGAKGLNDLLVVKLSKN